MIFKKGDKVFDHSYGWGVVESDSFSEDRPIWVNFWGQKCSYTQDGREDSECAPTLSFTEYTLEGFSQERPEPLPEKGQLVYVRFDNDSTWEMRYFSHYDGEYYCCFLGQRKDGATHSWKQLSIKNPLLSNG